MHQALETDQRDEARAFPPRHEAPVERLRGRSVVDDRALELQLDPPVFSGGSLARTELKWAPEETE
jgi:hypothetical protein